LREDIMGLGVALALIAVGAILAFATDFTVSGLDIQLVGVILIVVGLLSLAFTLLYVRPRRAGRTTLDGPPVYVAEPEEPILSHRDSYEAPVQPVRPVQPHVHRDPRDL